MDKNGSLQTGSFIFYPGLGAANLSMKLLVPTLAGVKMRNFSGRSGSFAAELRLQFFAIFHLTFRSLPLYILCLLVLRRSCPDGAIELVVYVLFPQEMDTSYLARVSWTAFCDSRVPSNGESGLLGS